MFMKEKNYMTPEKNYTGIPYKITSDPNPDKDGFYNGKLDMTHAVINIKFKATDIVKGDLAATLDNIAKHQTIFPNVVVTNPNNEYLNPEDFPNEDPPKKNYSHIPERYSGKIDVMLLANLMTDLNWFIIYMSESQQLYDEHYPSMEEILDSLVNTGKYELENNNLIIQVSLNSKESSYEIIINPKFFSDENYYLNIHSMLGELDESSSEIILTKGKKEVILKYPNLNFN